MSEAADRHPIPDRQRVDVWLFRARFFKTRSQAGQAVADGVVRMERAGQTKLLEKAAEPVSPGDVLLISAARGLGAVRVLALGARRGPPAEARALYEELAN
ncbi:MAG: S4 domain-containing protein [Hyphomonadaceae bacterium]